MIRRNFVSGVLASAWTALVAFGAVPYTLRYLGDSSYGLIGFLATLQTVFLVLDLGLAQTVNRETARAHAKGDLNLARATIHTLATIYWWVGIVIGVTICLAAPWIAGRWLHSPDLSADEMLVPLRLMGWIVAVRWPIGLYAGALMGVEQVSVVNLLNAASATLGNIGGVLVIAFGPRSIEALFTWQLAVGVLHVLSIRAVTWRILPGNSVRFDPGLVRKVMRFSVGVSAVTVTALILTQVDKLMLARMLPLSELGRYSLALMAARPLTMVVTALFNVMYPRFSALVAKEQEGELRRQYRAGSNALAIMLVPMTVVAIVAARPLVEIWTGNPEIAAVVAPAVAFVVAGTALNGVMYFPYSLQLAYGIPKLPVAINSMLIVVLVPATIFLTARFNIQGAAMAWFLLNVLYLAVGTWLTHRFVLRGLAAQWLLVDIGGPLACTLVGVAGAWMIVHTLSRWWAVGGASLVAVAATALAVCLSPHGHIGVMRRTLGAK